MERSREQYEAMVEAHYADLYRYAYWMSRNQDLAEDLVQETFMRAWRFFDRLEDPTKAKSWLITTLRREFARHFEKPTPPRAEIDLDTVPAPGNMGQPDVSDWVLRSTIERIPLKYREPLLLQAVLGMSGEEIGQQLGIPRATVNTRLFRARQALKRLMSDDEPLTSNRG
ncbi:MAG: sigma-70 family RNA polymerase sigma factor [Pseudomonadota bacterium]